MGRGRQEGEGSRGRGRLTGFPQGAWARATDPGAGADARRAATHELLELLWRPVFLHLRARWCDDDAAARARTEAFLEALVAPDVPSELRPGGPALGPWLRGTLGRWLRAGHEAPERPGSRAGGGLAHRVPALALAEGAPAWCARAPVDALLAASLLEGAAEELLTRLDGADAALLGQGWLAGTTPDEAALAARLGLAPEELLRARHRVLERLSTRLRERLARTLADDADLDRELALLLGRLPDAAALAPLAADLRAHEAARPAPTGQRELAGYLLGAPLEHTATHLAWRAQDPRLRRVVTLRVTLEPLAPGATPFRADGERFRTLCELEHPGLVGLLAGGETEAGLAELGEGERGPRRLFQVLEAQEGRALTEVLAEGPLPADEAVDHMRTAARALAAAHRSGLVHLELEPGSLWLRPGRGDRPDACLLTGFPLPDPRAGLAGDAPTARGGLTLAPEQLTRPRAELDARTDVHGLGTTLAALVTGTALPDDEDLAALDPRLQAVIERATARDPDDRYRSAAAFAAALEELREEQAGGPARRTAGAPAPDTRRRAALAGLGLLAVLLLVPLGLWLASDPDAERRPGADPTDPDGRTTDPRPGEPGEVRTSPEDYGLVDALTRLRQRLRPHLDAFSFLPPDLPALGLTLEHGELAQAITALVRDHGSRGMPVPRDLTSVDLLLALDRARASGGPTAGILTGLEDATRTEARRGAAADPAVLLAGALAALERGDGVRARELAEGLDHPAVSGVLAAADALEGGQPR